MNRLDDLIERTLKDDRRALPSSPGAVDDALHRAGRIHRRRIVVTSLASVVAVVAAVAIAVPLLADNGTTEQRGPQVTQPPGNPTPIETANPAPKLSSPLFTVTSSTTTDLNVTSTVMALHSLYVVGDESPASGSVTVERLDPVTLDVLARKDFGGTSGRLALSQSKVWLITQPSPANDSVATPPLYGLDQNSLDVVTTVPLDSVATAVAAGPADVWVATQTKLVGVDDSGKLKDFDPVSLPGPITDMSAFPAGDLYTLGEGPRSAQQITERDLFTATAVLGTYDGTGPGGGHLSAAPDGVWASLPTGTAGQVLFLTQNGLHPSGEQSASNQIDASLAGGLLWITDTDKLTCADPSSGASRDSDIFASGHTPTVLTGDATTTYLAHGVGIYAVTAKPACAG